MYHSAKTKGHCSKVPESGNREPGAAVFPGLSQGAITLWAVITAECRNAEKGHRAQLPRITGEATGTDKNDREVQ